QALADRAAGWVKLRGLDHDRAVDVDDLKPRGAPHLDGGLQQPDRVGVAPALVAVREMLAYVAQPGGAEQRVDQSGCAHVGVGVPAPPELPRNLPAAERGAAPRQQPMRVVADARE